MKIAAKHHGIHEIPPFGRLDSCAKGFVEAFVQAKVRLNKVSNWFLVERGVTLGSTNQKAGFRSRGTNGPISVQQEVM